MAEKIKKDKLIEDLNKEIEKLTGDIKNLRMASQDLLIKNDELKQQIRHLEGYRNQVDAQTEAIVSLSSALKFLADEVYCDNTGIEFAAIKTYRGGWRVMAVNGEMLDIGPNDEVTIFSPPNERINVQVSKQ